MTARVNSGNTREVPQVASETDKCSLALSSDGKWMRLTVDGNLIAAFHVNYVNKILGNSVSTVVRPKRRSAPTAEL